MDYDKFVYKDPGCFLPNITPQMLYQLHFVFLYIIQSLHNVKAELTFCAELERLPICKVPRLHNETRRRVSATVLCRPPWNQLLWTLVVNVWTHHQIKTLYYSFKNTLALLTGNLFLANECFFSTNTAVHRRKILCALPDAGGLAPAATDHCGRLAAVLPCWECGVLRLHPGLLCVLAAGSEACVSSQSIQLSPLPSMYIT